MFLSPGTENLDPPYVNNSSDFLWVVVLLLDLHGVPPVGLDFFEVK